jgi:hypothetical protein
MSQTCFWDNPLCSRVEGSNMTDAKDMTERESYIIAQALYEFIRFEQSKPIDERRSADEQDAKAILHARFDNELVILAQSDEAAGREPPDCERKSSIGG